MHHVFVSYTRADGAWVAELVGRLERAGRATWVDQRDIPISLPWFEEIADAIAAADLFLICDSPAARDSPNCSAEAQLAFDAGRQALTVEVGSDVAVAAGEVVAALADLDPDYVTRTELAVLARDWDRSGRARNRLVGAATRRRLTRAAHAHGRPSDVERAFMRASRRRARQRVAVSAAIGLVSLGSVGLALALDEANERFAESNHRQAVDYIRTQAALADIADDPYSGLARAATLGRDERATRADVIAEALEDAVPNDAFRVPDGARRFASTPVGEEVVVTDGAGRRWGRDASARDVRRAAPVGAPAEAPSAAPPTGLRARRHGAAVDVLRGRRLWRRIEFGRSPTHLRVSPSGRELAAVAGDAVEIADLELGAVRRRLRGGPASVRDLAWSADGHRIWALGDGRVVSWSARAGTRLVDEPGTRFEALLPGGSPDTAWTVAHDGELREIDVRHGRALRRIDVADEVHAGAGSPDGSVAVLSGDRGIWIVPLVGGAPRLVPVPDCSLGRAAVRDEEMAHVPCIGGPILTVSLARGRVLERLDLGPAGAFAAKVLPRSGVLLVTDTFAGLLAVTESGDLHELYRNACGGSLTRIAVAPDDSVVAPVGAGTGMVCSRRGLLTGEDPASPSSWRFDVVHDDVASYLAGAAAVSNDGGTLAYGYADGTVILHAAENALPAVGRTDVVGAVRDMLVTPSNRVLVASDAGIVHGFQLCEGCVSNRALAAVARTRLERAVELGLARRRR